MQRVGGSTPCFSIEDEGVLSRGEVATCGWEPTGANARQSSLGVSSSNVSAIFWEWRAGERKELQFLEPAEEDRWRHEGKRK